MKLGTTQRSLGAVLGAAFAAVLASCARDAPPVTPTPPADAPTALVYGAAYSPILEALTAQVEVTVSDGSQKATDFDLLILDGDSFGAEELREERLVHNAIRGGVWVLGLDLREDEKHGGIAHLLGAGTPGESAAYLVRQVRTPNGHPSNTHIDFPDEGTDAERQAERIVAYVRGEDLQPQQNGADEEPADPLLGALFSEHHFSQVHDFTLPRNNNPDYPDQPLQTASWTQSGTLRVYFETTYVDETHVFGRQWVAVERRGRVELGPLAHLYNNCEASCPGPDSPRPSYEIAWPLTQVSAETEFQVHSVPLFTLVSSSPASGDAQSAVTSASFTIKTQVPAGPGGPASGTATPYTYTASATRDLTDWRVENDSGAPDAASPNALWRFASARPWDGLNTQSAADEQIGSEPLTDPSLFTGLMTQRPTVSDPNRLAQRGLSYATSSVWRAGAGIDISNFRFGGTDTLWFTDAWVRGGSAQPNASFASVSRHSHPETWGLTLDLSAVLPVVIQSVSLRAEGQAQANTVTAGQSATGTVTLREEANADAVVYLSSLSEFVTLETPTITIPKGSASGTFTVRTTGEGRCEAFTAQIEAFYGSGKRQEVTLLPPEPSDPSCS